MLIDTHCHLGHREFHHDLPEILQRAESAGVQHCIMPAVDIANSRLLLELAAQHKQLLPCVGIHPCDVHSVPRVTEGGLDLSWFHELRTLASHPRVAAIGETGLDYYHKPEPGCTQDEWRTQQAAVLRLHLQLAAELGLPAILHARESQAALVEQVRPFTGKVRCVFHCFTGTLAEAQEVAALGHLVSFTGVVTYNKRVEHIQEAAAKLPAGSFMIETDSPFLSPVPHRGKRCEPAFVADTARFIAQLRSESLAELAAHTSATARAFFRWPD